MISFIFLFFAIFKVFLYIELYSILVFVLRVRELIMVKGILAMF